MADTERTWDFVRIARKWQQRWLADKSFEPVPEPESGRKKFFFTVPYPYVSGLLHVGHGRTYTNGDVIARFHRMLGENVLWPMAFHITGTPVLAVSGKIKTGDSATIKMFQEHVSIYEQDPERVKQIVESFAEPWKLVNYFSSKLISDFTAMGYSLDLSRQFTTGDPEYNKFIEWQFHNYKDKGFLRQASYPLLYCMRDKNAVGEDDIADGDSNPVEVQKFSAFKFKLDGDDAFVVSCTLRPETVFGITNQFVNPSATYVKLKISSPDGKFSEDWFVSKQASEKLAMQNVKVDVLQELSGEFFVGKWVTDPLGKRVPILPAAFVDPANATGFVHSVPAHAPYDYVAIESLRKDKLTLERYSKVKLAESIASIKPIAIISLDGYSEYPAEQVTARMGIVNTRDVSKLDKATKELYRAEFYGGKMLGISGQFTGLPVIEAKDKVLEWLKTQGKAADFYETSRPAICRCGGQVVAAIMPDQWFIDFSTPGWKESAGRCLDGMTIYPPIYRKQFEDVFAWLDKRPCARRRGLGTQLPFANEWIIESLSDSTIYMAFYTIIKAIRTAGLKPAQLTREFFDYIFLGTGSADNVARNLSLAPTTVQLIRDEFLYWYPNDLRHTGIAHITNHLSFFIFAHTAIFPPELWPKGITLNELVISEGTKMSKSKGNVVLLHAIANTIGPDVFRLYCAGAADLAGVLDYRARDAEAAGKVLIRFANSIAYLQELKNSSGTMEITLGTHASDWMISKFERSVVECKAALQDFRIRDYIQTALYNLLNDFDYFTRRATPVEKRLVADAITDRWIQLLSPVTPHLCEELWEQSGRTELVSLSSWPSARANMIKPVLEVQEDLVKSVASDARKIRDVLKNRKTPTKLIVITATGEKTRKLVYALGAATAQESANEAKDENLAAHILKNFYALKAIKETLVMVDEYSVLTSAKDFLSNELKLVVSVEKEEASTNQKASKALPGRPAIVLE